MKFAVRHRGGRAAGLALAAALVAGCNDSGLGPDIFGDVAGFTTTLALDDLQSEAATGVVRVEVAVREDGIVLRRVEVSSADDLGESEMIRASVGAVDAGSGVLTLNLGQLAVTFDAATEFTNSEGESLTLEGFLAAVAEGIEAESPTWVRVRRAPADAPQGPDDAAFHAAGVRVLHDEHEPGFALNVDQDNLVVNESPPPDAYLDVLGLRFEIRASEGLTEIARERDDLDFVDFEGSVIAVDFDDHSFVLENGTIVRVVDHTAIRFEEGDRHRLGSLDDVAQALASGYAVYSAGDGALQHDDPRTIVAAHVVWEVDLDLAEFEGLIATVDVNAGTATLENGTVVRIDPHTHIKQEDDHPQLLLGSLEDVAAALAAGDDVGTFGEGQLESENPRTILAFYAAFRRHVVLEDFEGVVAEVMPDAGMLVLADGIVVHVTDNTLVNTETDHHLANLGAVADALAAGRSVVARGDGEIESEDPLTILALRAAFTIRVEDFEADVEIVDQPNASVTLAGGIVVEINTNTVIKETGDLHTLQAVADAIGGGQAVVARGEGEVTGDDPLTIDAYHVEFTIRPPTVPFDQIAVASVDPQNSTFTLGDATEVLVTHNTIFDPESDLESLAGLAEALDAGHSVAVRGEFLETPDPTTGAQIAYRLLFTVTVP